MKVRKIANKDMPEPLANDLIDGKVYVVIGISKKLKWYRIIDESGEDYLYPPQLFEIVEE